MNKIILSVMIFGMAMAAVPSFAQNINSIENRLNRMEREMQTLSRSIFRGDVPPPSIQVQGGNNAQTAAMEMRLNQLEEQMRRLTGMIEENTFRLRKLEQGQGAGSGSSTSSSMSNPTPPSPQAPSAPSFAVDDTPYQLGTITNNNSSSPAGLYDQAFAYMQVNDYAAAQQSFENFLSQYATHSLAPNAKYWLAETHFARNDFQSASRGFARYFKDHPDGQKAPETLLKLAMSLNGQNMTEEACLTLQELRNRFPDAQPRLLQKADQERQAYSCRS